MPVSAENEHLLSVIDFSEGLAIFVFGEKRPLKVFDAVCLREVTLPEIRPEMRLTVSPRCSYVLGFGIYMFYIWKRNEVEAPVYSVFFEGSRTNIGIGYRRIGCCCFSSDSKVAVVVYRGLDKFDFAASIHDLDTGSYKLVMGEFLLYRHVKPFCSNEVLILACYRGINIFDLNTGAHIDSCKQRYLGQKYQGPPMRLSPNGTTFAVPINNDDMEFIRFSTAQNSLFSSKKAEAVARWKWE